MSTAATLTASALNTWAGQTVLQTGAAIGTTANNIAWEFHTHGQMIGAAKTLSESIKFMGKLPTAEVFCPPLYKWGALKTIVNGAVYHPNSAVAFYGLATCSNVFILGSGLRDLNENRIQAGLTFGVSNIIGAVGGMLPKGGTRTTLLLTSNVFKIIAGLYETAAGFDNPHKVKGNRFKEDNQGKPWYEVIRNVAKGTLHSVHVTFDPAAKTQADFNSGASVHHDYSLIPANPAEVFKGGMKVSRDALQILGGSVIAGSVLAKWVGNTSGLLTSNLGLMSIIQGLTSPSGIDVSIMTSGACQYTSAPFSKFAVDPINYRNIANATWSSTGGRFKLAAAALSIISYFAWRNTRTASQFVAPQYPIVNVPKAPEFEYFAQQLGPETTRTTHVNPDGLERSLRATYLSEAQRRREHSDARKTHQYSTPRLDDVPLQGGHTEPPILNWSQQSFEIIVPFPHYPLLEVSKNICAIDATQELPPNFAAPREISAPSDPLFLPLNKPPQR